MWFQISRQADIVRDSYLQPKSIIAFTYSHFKFQSLASSRILLLNTCVSVHSSPDLFADHRELFRWCIFLSSNGLASRQKKKKETHNLKSVSLTGVRYLHVREIKTIRMSMAIKACLAASFAIQTSPAFQALKGPNLQVG
jgi:hypothetical protein